MPCFQGSDCVRRPESASPDRYPLVGWTAALTHPHRTKRGAPRISLRSANISIDRLHTVDAQRSPNGTVCHLPLIPRQQVYTASNMSDNGEVEVESSAVFQAVPKDVLAEQGSVKLFNKWSYEDVEIRDISLTYVNCNQVSSATRFISNSHRSVAARVGAS